MQLSPLFLIVLRTVGTCLALCSTAVFAAPSDMRVETLHFDVSSLTFPVALLRTETSTTIEVTLPADILFDFDKSDIRPQAQTTLHELALLLREKARGAVTIQGFTDSLGNDVYNQRLSERRAASVKSWLVTREGLASMQFATSGLGARNPVAPNRNPDGSDNPDGRQMNRRVTIVFRK